MRLKRSASPERRTPAPSKPTRPRRSGTTSRTAARAALQAGQPVDAKPKFNLSKVSKPGDALKAILERKQAEAAAKAAPPRPTAPSSRLQHRSTLPQRPKVASGSRRRCVASPAADRRTGSRAASCPAAPTGQHRRSPVGPGHCEQASRRARHRAPTSRRRSCLPALTSSPLRLSAKRRSLRRRRQLRPQLSRRLP